MNTYETICSRRSIREYEDKSVSYDLLEKFVNAGRLAPQAANRQPLEFIIVDDPDLVKEFFGNIRLGSYLEWSPSLENSPRAYIVILGNTDIQKSNWISFDIALAAENITLAAWEEGVASCLVGAFNKNKVIQSLNIPNHYEVTLMVALGYPAHKSFAEDMKGDDVQYWRDDNGDFHVPKRPMKKVLHHNKF